MKNSIVYYMIGFLHSGDIADFDSDDNPKVPCTMHYGLNVAANTLSLFDLMLFVVIIPLYLTYILTIFASSLLPLFPPYSPLPLFPLYVT